MPHFPKCACLFSTLVMVAAAGACSSTTATSGPRIEVSLTVQQPAASGSVLLVSVGGRSIELRASETLFQRKDTSLDADAFGTLPVLVTLMGMGADTLATVSFSQAYESGYGYGIGAVVSRSRPVGVCAGTVLATALRSSTSDTLFVSYAGLPHGAIC